jgi:hypothetical protein
VHDGAWVHKGIIHSVEIVGSILRIWVIENNPHRRGVGYRTLEDFSNGRSVWIERPAQSCQEANAIVSRAESQFGRPYHLLTFNCEHFVTQALGLEAESKQLQQCALTAALGLTLALALASGAQSRR